MCETERLGSTVLVRIAKVHHTTIWNLSRPRSAQNLATLPDVFASLS